jgi:hypothetical protein
MVTKISETEVIVFQVESKWNSNSMRGMFEKNEGKWKKSKDLGKLKVNEQLVWKKNDHMKLND